ncbi:hypothetical protein V8Z80_01025 [Orrella sp. JC864]|uniref:hypothetical protein n=1 Tax=Orrella sp. JC864 TaxID=3120298 RepID=UPI0012BCBF59
MNGFAIVAIALLLGGFVLAAFGMSTGHNGLLAAGFVLLVAGVPALVVSLARKRARRHPRDG